MKGSLSLSFHYSLIIKSQDRVSLTYHSFCYNDLPLLVYFLFLLDCFWGPCLYFYERLYAFRCHFIIQFMIVLFTQTSLLILSQCTCVVMAMVHILSPLMVVHASIHWSIKMIVSLCNFYYIHCLYPKITSWH